MPSSSEQSSYSTRVTLVTVIARKALGSAATREGLDARDPHDLVRWRASEHRQGRSRRKRRAGLALLVDAALADTALVDKLHAPTLHVPTPHPLTLHSSMPHPPTLHS